jgi:putative aminopeptidase FrvX
VDQLWVDIGASSRAEVERLGVALLDPVMPDRPTWTFAGHATGPAAGARASCAAVATAAQQAPTRGENVYVLSTQRIFGWLGLSAAIARLGAVDQVTLVESGRAQRLDSRLAAGRLPSPMRALNGRISADSVSVLGPAVQWAGSLVETIANDEANALLAWVQREAALPATPLPWVSLPSDTARRLEPRADAYGALEREFFTLADLPGVSGHEGPVREAVLRALPAWARERAVVDAKGNIVVTAGGGGDAMAVVAHLDEVGFEVRGIQPDGRVMLQNRGGAVLPSWEGVPAYLHFDTPGVAPLRGVFVPRDSGKTRSPGSLTAWFGFDSAQLAARGVRPGLSLTAYKRGARLAGTRVTARASDDRTGSGALLAAVRALDPGRIKRRVYFVWAVEEELGLNGARAFGEAHGTELTRVYAVDTFVSSDTPLESPHFAYAMLGKGAVLRGLDDGSLSPRAERERVIRIAKAAGIPLQVGTTQGSTDGSAVSPWGAPNAGLSWPGRYSHGPAEVLDLRDVDALKRLIEAVVTAP